MWINNDIYRHTIGKFYLFVNLLFVGSLINFIYGLCLIGHVIFAIIGEFKIGVYIAPAVVISLANDTIVSILF